MSRTNNVEAILLELKMSRLLLRNCTHQRQIDEQKSISCVMSNGVKLEENEVEASVDMRFPKIYRIRIRE